MRFVPFRAPSYVAAATFALMTSAAALAAGHGGGGGGGFHGGAPQMAPLQGAGALPARGQWVANNGFGGPGYHWSPARGHGMARHAGWRHGRFRHHHYGRRPYLDGYGVGYLGGGAYDVGYYGGNGVYYGETFYGYTPDLYRPGAYTAASGYDPIVGPPVYFDLTADQPVVPPVYRPAVIADPSGPLPHIIDLSTAKESPNVIR